MIAMSRPPGSTPSGLDARARGRRDTGRASPRSMTCPFGRHEKPHRLERCSVRTLGSTPTPLTPSGTADGWRIASLEKPPHSLPSSVVRHRRGPGRRADRRHLGDAGKLPPREHGPAFGQAAPRCRTVRGTSSAAGACAGEQHDCRSAGFGRDLPQESTSSDVDGCPGTDLPHGSLRRHERIARRGHLGGPERRWRSRQMPRQPARSGHQGAGSPAGALRCPLHTADSVEVERAPGSQLRRRDRVTRRRCLREVTSQRTGFGRTAVTRDPRKRLGSEGDRHHSSAARRKQRPGRHSRAGTWLLRAQPSITLVGSGDAWSGFATDGDTPHPRRARLRRWTPVGREHRVAPTRVGNPPRSCPGRGNASPWEHRALRSGNASQGYGLIGGARP